MFVNPEVPLESLPSAAELDWRALDPAFVRCQQAKALLRWAPLPSRPAWRAVYGSPSIRRRSPWNRSSRGGP